MACDSCSTDQERVEYANAPLTTPLPQSASSAGSSAQSKSSEQITAQSLVAKQKFPVESPKVPFTPCYMFFYGSLMDIDILQLIAGLKSSPTMAPATITGFRMRMWGPFPTIIKAETGKVTGTYWKCDQEDHFQRLKAYETNAYSWCFCDAETEDGKVLKGCRTFCWRGNPESDELEDGKFDLAHYQKYTKGRYV